MKNLVTRRQPNPHPSARAARLTINAPATEPPAPPPSPKPPVVKRPPVRRSADDVPGMEIVR